MSGGAISNWDFFTSSSFIIRFWERGSREGVMNLGSESLNKSILVKHRPINRINRGTRMSWENCRG